VHADLATVTLQEALDALADPVRRSILRELSAGPDFTDPAGRSTCRCQKRLPATLHRAPRHGLLEQDDRVLAGSTGAARGVRRAFSRPAHAGAAEAQA